MGYCTDNNTKCIKFATIIIAFLLCVSLLIYCLYNNAPYVVEKDYSAVVEEIHQEETQLRVGHRIRLSEKELLVNKYFLKIKRDEYDEGVKNPQKFFASQPVYKVKENITNSHVFQFLKRMPKGALLHVHDTAASSESFLFNLTYDPNLYVCLTNNTVRFQFASSTPTIQLENLNCSWALLSDLRAQSENISEFNQQLRTYMSLIAHKNGNLYERYPTGRDLWIKFNELFNVLRSLLTYRPAFEKTWTNFLHELYADNVQYIEARSSLKKLYELNGTIHDEIQVAKIIQNVIDEFKRNHTDFFDAKIIYSKAKVRPSIKQDIETFIKLKENFPDLIIGFDLVGHEERSYPLSVYLDELKQMPLDTHYFFHAGETNWFGTDVDWNMLDAILLKSKRIGHGYAILKHPKLLELLRKYNVTIEVSPLSNQMLGHITDLRNHPAAVLLAMDVAVVIGNDDPAFWGVEGVTYDFYEATMAFLSRDNDLRAVKQLVMNSVDASDLDDFTQRDLRKLVREKWDEFIDEIVNEIGVGDDHV